MDTNYKMSGLEKFQMFDLEIFLRTTMKPCKTLCNVFELALAIRILFVFGRIIS